jgi:alkylhydroperoxidase family enzyme
VGRDSGISIEKLSELERYAVSSHYSEAERVALEYAERITRSDEDVDDELFDRLRAEYTDEQVMELTLTVGLENCLSKIHHALLIESHGFCVVPQRARGD